MSMVMAMFMAIQLFVFMFMVRGPHDWQAVEHGCPQVPVAKAAEVLQDGSRQACMQGCRRNGGKFYVNDNDCQHRCRRDACRKLCD